MAKIRNLYRIGCNPPKENHKKNDYNGRKSKNRRIFDLQTNPKTMTHETKAKLKAALATGYIVLTACLGLAFFGRFVLAIVTN
jgi:hypothetical protein